MLGPDGKPLPAASKPFGGNAPAASNDEDTGDGMDSTGKLSKKKALMHLGVTALHERRRKHA